jgi:hypothetical protein
MKSQNQYYQSDFYHIKLNSIYTTHSITDIQPSVAHQLAVLAVCKPCNKDMCTVLTITLNNELQHATGMHIHDWFQTVKF